MEIHLRKPDLSTSIRKQHELSLRGNFLCSLGNLYLDNRSMKTSTVIGTASWHVQGVAKECKVSDVLYQLQLGIKFASS